MFWVKVFYYNGKTEKRPFDSQYEADKYIEALGYHGENIGIDTAKTMCWEED